MKTNLIKTSILASALVAAMSAQAAATFVIVNNDGPGEGFNDATVVAPVGGNTGTTLGQQRLNAFQVAADNWARVIQSSVPIRIRSNFDPQTCNTPAGSGAVLGSAGAASIFSDFPSTAEADTWFASAESDALAGTDQGPTGNDINATFNLSIDAACLPGTTGWWYGTDPAIAPPAGTIPLLPVLLHEFGHGLGFQTYTDRTTGAFNTGRKDIWSRFLFDNQLAKGWRAMTDAERVTSSINDPFLVWNGPSVSGALATTLGPSTVLRITLPAAIAGSSIANPAAFGPAITTTTAQIVLADDGALPNDDACTPLTNGAAVTGKIVLIVRGACNFTVKVANAQAAGAIGVVVYNNAATGLPGMGGADPAVTIPSIGVTQALGQQIIAQTVAVTGSITTDAALPAGTNAGKLRMHAPNPLVGGSSVSHWTTDAFPNLLMEPAINNNLFDQVDLTRNLFQDIFWPLAPVGGGGTIVAVTPSGAFSLTLGIAPSRAFAFTGGPGTATCVLTPATAPFTVSPTSVVVPGSTTVTATGVGSGTLTCSNGATVLATYTLRGFASPVPVPGLNLFGLLGLLFGMLGVGFVAARKN
jgi:hypothetical protein